MPALSPFEIIDRDTVTHTYEPIGSKDGVHFFSKADANGVVIGESTLSVSLRKTPANNKLRVKVVIPTVQTETVNGVSRPRIVYQNWANIELVFSESSTTADRQLLIDHVTDMFTSRTGSTLDEVAEDVKDLY
jgi:hypothetical protein